jgi:hypothetical protein
MADRVNLKHRLALGVGRLDEFAQFPRGKSRDRLPDQHFNLARAIQATIARPWPERTPRVID